MERSRPLVSICIPTYNYGHYLGEAVASALDQTCEEIEVIVADDASTDSTAQVMARFADDPRVRYLDSEKNLGMFTNFNRCWRESRGRYVKFLMADDWLAKSSVAELVDSLEASPGAVLASANNWMIDAEGKIFGEQVNQFGASGEVDPRRTVAILSRGFNAIGMPSNTLIPLELLERIGGFESTYQPAGDLHLWLRLLALGPLAWCENRLCFLRFHDAHTHEWSDTPDVSTLQVWRDAPKFASEVVDPARSKRGQRNCSQLFTNYGLKFLAGGNFAEARRMFSATREYAGVTGGASAFVRSLPQAARSRREVAAARKQDLTVAYAPYPTRGRPLAELTAVAERAIGPRLSAELAGA